MRNYSETAMRTVKVDKAQLITKLRENKEKHGTDFKESMNGYWDAFGRELTKMQERVKARDLNVEHTVRLTRPKDHTDEYERAIQMLEWEQEKQVVLSINDFNCYVLDDFDWKEEFEGTKALYSGGRR